MKFLLQYIQQPYPTPNSGKTGFLLSLGMGIFIAIFLLFFLPFDLNLLDYTFQEISFFGFITFVVFFVAHNLIPPLLPSLFKENKWTVGYQVLFYLAILFVIATLNGLYINHLNSLDFKWSNYWFIINRTIGLGIIPISLYVLVSHNWKFSKMVQNANQINQKLLPPSKEQVPFKQVIQTKLKEGSFTIEDHTFLFAKADGNYIHVYRLNQKPTMYRMNLIDFENQISNNQFLRCHRSYLVNMLKVKKISGNAQGLQLWLEQNDVFVPVSRKYISKIKEVFTQQEIDH